LAGASSESGVVDNGNFCDLSDYFFGNFTDMAGNIKLRVLVYSD